LEFSEAIPHLEHALQYLSPDEHAVDVIQTHLDLARSKAFTGKTEEAEQHAATALALAQAHGILAMQAAAHNVLGLIAHFRVDIDGAMAHYSEAIPLARRSSEPEAYLSLGTSLNNVALLHQERGEFAQELRLRAEALEAARRVRDVRQVAFMSSELGRYYFLRGDWQAAKRYFLDNLTMELSPEGRKASEYTLRTLEGDLEASASLARDLLEHHRRTGNTQGIFIYSALLAADNLELGRIQETRDAAAEGAGVAEGDPHFLLWIPAAFVAEGLARGGDYQRCETLCAKGEALSRATKSPPGLAAALFGQAVLALERGDPDAAVRLLDETLPLAKPVPFHASILKKLAHALTRRGNPGDLGRAKETLRECLTLLEQMGDTRRAERVRVELASLA
jgi:tetratricopeptide (TPR) repeat protein